MKIKKLAQAALLSTALVVSSISVYAAEGTTDTEITTESEAGEVSAEDDAEAADTDKAENDAEAADTDNAADDAEAADTDKAENDAEAADTDNAADDAVSDNDGEGEPAEDEALEAVVTEQSESEAVSEENDIMLLADEGETTDEEKAAQGIPTEVHWNDEYSISFTLNHDSGFYSYELYKGEESIFRSWTSSSIKKGNSAHTTFLPIKGYNFAKHQTEKSNGGIWESGTYKVRVKALETSDTVDDLYNFSEGRVSDFSEGHVYTAPTESLGIPQNLRWKGNGVLQWDAVTNADSYWVVIRSSSAPYETGEYYANASETSIDLSKYFTSETDTYTIVVNARANNRTAYFDSDFSAEITYKAGDGNAEVAQYLTEQISTLSDASSADEITAVKKSITEKYKDDRSALQIAMQSNSVVQEQIKYLDSLYQKAGNVTISTPTVADELALDADKISMVGAALNADRAANVQLSLSKPEQEIAENYKNSYYKAIQFDISATGITNTDNLAIPITITMPVPNGINPARLVILHKNTDGNFESEVVKDNGDGTISFTITHFSDFIFAEEIVKESTGTTSDSSDTSADEGSSAATTTATAVKAAPQPIIGTAKGWSSLAAKVNAAIADVANGTQPIAIVTVQLNGVSEIPASVLETIAGKEVIVSFITKEGAFININGSMLDAANIGKASIVTFVDANGNTTLRIRNAAADISKSVSVFIKANAAVTQATLYFIDADGSLISFRDSLVYDNGYTAFDLPFVNADYIMQ